MKVLLLHPPVSNLETPYLSVPALSAFLKERGVDVTCVDLNVLAFDRLLSGDFITEAGQICEQRYGELDSRESLSLAEAEEYARIAPFIPRWKFLADHIDGIKACIRGEEKQGAFGKFTAFEELIKQALELIFLPFRDSERMELEFLQVPHHIPWPVGILYSSDRLVEWTLNGKSRFDRVFQELLAPYLAGDFDLVGISVSFSDQLAQALKIAELFKSCSKKPYLVLGGAYVSRVMPDLKNPRLFDLVDAIILNDGEAPLWELIRSREKKEGMERVPSVLWKNDAGTVCRNPMQPAIPLGELPPPDFSFTPFDKYLVDRNKMELPLMLSHGCYWQKCAFCNNQLPLVLDFHMQDARKHILPKIQHLVATYGVHRFNFVDEAMPPVALSDVSQAILEEGLGIIWHGNVRAEDFFTFSVCQLMFQAGCQGVQIGVESLNDDTLRGMKKGTTVERLTRVISNFHDAGIAVHAYMIYGWPTETRKHTANTLRTLKKLIIQRKVSSVFWHGFVLNPSAPMFRNPCAYGIRNCKFNADEDIFDSPVKYEVAEGFEDHEDAVLLRRIDELTKNLLMRVKSEGPVVSEEDLARESFSQSGILEKAVIFPRHVVISGGHYSLSEIKEKTARQEASFERKPRFRILNLLTGASQEVSEDVYEIIQQCRSASQRGEPLRSAVVELAREWGLESGEVEEAVLSVLPPLVEVGICLSGRNFR